MSPDLGQVWTNVYDECGSSNDSPSSYFEAIPEILRLDESHDWFDSEPNT